MDLFQIASNDKESFDRFLQIFTNNNGEEVVLQSLLSEYSEAKHVLEREGLKILEAVGENIVNLFHKKDSDELAPKDEMTISETFENRYVHTQSSSLNAVFKPETKSVETKALFFKMLNIKFL